MDDLAGDDVTEPTLLIMLYTSVEARSSISKVQVRKIAYLVLNISDSLLIHLQPTKLTGIPQLRFWTLLLETFNPHLTGAPTSPPGTTVAGEEFL